MITDKQMAAAAEELFNAMLNSLPDEEECDHRFSPQFEKKMERLIRRAEQPFRYRMMGSVASIALAIILGFMALLAASPSVRATFFGWVKEQYEAFARYYFVGESTENSEWNSYELSYIPEGYVEWQRNQKGNTAFVMYENRHTSQSLLFVCSRDYDSLSVYAMSENCTIESIQINGKPADLIIPNEPDNATAILWYEPDTNSFCVVSAHLNLDELILIAESVK